MLFVKSVTSARAASLVFSAMCLSWMWIWKRCPLAHARVFECALLAGPDELEVAVHVEAIAVGHRVLVDLPLGLRVIVGEHLLVAAALEPALRGREDHLAVRRALLGVDA